MSEFTQEDLEWLEEHGFEQKRADYYVFESKDDFSIHISLMPRGFWCKMMLYCDNDNPQYEATGNTIKDAVKHAFFKLRDIDAKRDYCVQTIRNITSKFVCGYEKGVTTPSVKQFIESLSIDELRYIVRQFSEWYNEEGCPYGQHDFKCDFFDTEEFAEDASAGNCPYAEYEHACWVKYFLEQYKLEKHEK